MHPRTPAPSIIKVNPPETDEAALLTEGKTLISFFWPAQNEELLKSKDEARQLLSESDSSRRALLSVVEDQKLTEKKLEETLASLEQRIVERTAEIAEPTMVFFVVATEYNVVALL